MDVGCEQLDEYLTNLSRLYGLRYDDEIVWNTVPLNNDIDILKYTIECRRSQAIMKKKPTLVAGIAIIAVALIFGLFVFSPSLGRVQEIDVSEPKNITLEDVAQMDVQLDKADRLSNQDMNIEQVLNTILNTCSSKALNYDLEGITACNEFMEGHINIIGIFLVSKY